MPFVKKQSDAERFWSKVRKGLGCWEWTGTFFKETGYGRFAVGSRTDGTRRDVKAHRFVYELVKLPIPEGKLVRHTCDNPACVRPEHLLVGTDLDNVLDRVERDRGATKERHPKAKLTETQVEEIRQLYGPAVGRAGRGRKGPTQQELAERFGVTQPVISAIIRQTTWR
jgi:hypothetical protein